MAQCVCPDCLQVNSRGCYIKRSTMRSHLKRKRALRDQGEHSEAEEVVGAAAAAAATDIGAGGDTAAGTDIGAERDIGMEMEVEMEKEMEDEVDVEMEDWPPLDNADELVDFDVDPPMDHDEEAPAANPTPDNAPEAHPDAASPRQSPAIEEESVGWTAWRIVMLLVACLNLHFHLSYRGCYLALSVLKSVFFFLGLFSTGDKPASTLKTVYRRLDLEDRFEVLPMCPTCHRVFPANSDCNLRCEDCDEALFKTKTTLVEDFGGTGEVEEHQTSTPVLRLPFRTISSQLEELLARDGMEDDLDSWRYVRRRDDRLVDIMDGRVWKTLKGADGRFFFDNSPNRADPDTLYIGVTLGYDGFGPGDRSQSGPHDLILV